MLKIGKILVSQPRPAVIEKSPFYEISRKWGTGIDYHPFIRVEGIPLKEFRSQRVDILQHTAVIFTSRTTVDSFFRLCEEARITVPESMKYLCQTEAVALYLQKYIVYRKRKIFFADGTYTRLVELIVKHKDENFLLTLSEPHKPELPTTLAKLKLPFDEVILARTVPNDLSTLSPAAYDLLVFYAPAEVAALVGAFPGAALPAVATFGDGTARAAASAGLKLVATAPSPAAPSMAKAIDLLLERLAAGEEPTPVTPAQNHQADEFIRSQQNKLSRRARAKRPASEPPVKKR